MNENDIEHLRSLTIEAHSAREIEYARAERAENKCKVLTAALEKAEAERDDCFKSRMVLTDDLRQRLEVAERSRDEAIRQRDEIGRISSEFAVKKEKDLAASKEEARRYREALIVLKNILGAKKHAGNPMMAVVEKALAASATNQEGKHE